MRNSILNFLIITLLLVACSNDDDTTTNCDLSSIISASQFENAPKDQHVINSVELNGNCLNISFSASGCDGESWEIMLIDAQVITLSLPPQRSLRLSLKNEEACDAFITKELSFDISSLQGSANEVLLNIQGFNDVISNTY